MNIVSHPKYRETPRVTAVRPIGGFQVHLTFSDGMEKDIDLGPYLEGPVFEAIRRDPQLFASIYIDGDTVAWPNGADIDPDTLYYEGPPPWAKEERRQEPARTFRQ